MRNLQRHFVLAALSLVSLLGTTTAVSAAGYIETDLVVNQQVNGVPTLTDANGIVHVAKFLSRARSRKRRGRTHAAGIEGNSGWNNETGKPVVRSGHHPRRLRQSARYLGAYRPGLDRAGFFSKENSNGQSAKIFGARRA